MLSLNNKNIPSWVKNSNVTTNIDIARPEIRKIPIQKENCKLVDGKQSG